MTIRPGRDADGNGFIALIGACWAEYPGVVLDVDGELPELRALASYYGGRGGALWAAECDGRIVGMIGTVPHAAEAWEIVRLYVLRQMRGSDLAPRLLATAETHARHAGAARLVLWSDTRFDRAHRFYEKHSYVRHGPIRVLHDISNSLEFAYAKPVSGIEVLDAAAATSAVRRLTELLRACVAAGASVGYLPPLDPEIAAAHWRRVATEVAAGRCRLLAAWQDAALVGTATLQFAAAADQAHRAEVHMVLVHPEARRQGIGRSLMAQAASLACQAGKTLLTLNAPAGDAAEALFRATGWHEAGRIPGFMKGTDKAPRDTIIFWQPLPRT